jgi:acyl carrier protein
MELIKAMDDRDIFDDMVTIFRTYARDKEALDAATPDTGIVTDLKVNSARIVDVMIQFEDKFGIDIEDEDFNKMNKIGDAVSMIKGKLSY